MGEKIKNNVLYFLGIIIIINSFTEIETHLFSVNGKALSNKDVVLISLNVVGDIVRNSFALLLIVIGVVALRVVFDSNRNKSIEYLSGFQKEFKSEIKNIGFTSKLRFSVPFFIAFSLLSLKIIPPFISVVINYKLLVLNLAFLIAPITLAEEVIFRYGIFKYIRQMRINVVISYLISAIIFGSGHFYKNDGLSPIFSVIWVSAVGILLQMVYEGSGWSIYPGWGFHLLDDIAAILINIPRK